MSSLTIPSEAEVDVFRSWTTQLEEEMLEGFGTSATPLEEEKVEGFKTSSTLLGVEGFETSSTLLGEEGVEGFNASAAPLEEERAEGFETSSTLLGAEGFGTSATLFEEEAVEGFNASAAPVEEDWLEGFGTSTIPLEDERMEGFPTSAAPSEEENEESFETTDQFEEENVKGFEKYFYPMTLGEVIKGRYKVLAKLGFGSASTVWCCRILGTNNFAALKIYVHSLFLDGETENETAIYSHLNNAPGEHPGKSYVRKMRESFFVTSSAGYQHHCLVHEVLANDIYNLRHIHPKRKLPEELLRQFLIHLLLALDFLHDECHIIHTDIKETNILLGLIDQSILEQLETKEFLEESLYKTVDGYNIYKSVDFGLQPTWGRPILCDFSLAQNGELEHCQDIQPEPYRAPEVILEMPWGYAVDVWNVGVMIWDMFEDRHMFDGINPETGEYENRFHLASIVGLLGPPPLEFLQRSEFSSIFFDENGNWMCENPIPSLSWEDSEENLEGSSKKAFLDFVRRMVRWVPESRAKASELLNDPWILRKPDE